MSRFTAKPFAEILKLNIECLSLRRADCDAAVGTWPRGVVEPEDERQQQLPSEHGIVLAHECWRGVTNHVGRAWNSTSVQIEILVDDRLSAGTIFISRRGRFDLPA
jgi:hypothetical protein